MKSPINNVKFQDIPQNETSSKTIRAIENPLFFKAMYTLLRAVFPMLRRLR